MIGASVVGEVKVSYGVAGHEFPNVSRIAQKCDSAPETAGAPLVTSYRVAVTSDKLRSRRLSASRTRNPHVPSMSPVATVPLRVAVGGDHAGFPLKKWVVELLRAGDVPLIDCGTDDYTSCDYPDFAAAVSREIVTGKADRGVLVCGSGVGVSVAANKIKGIRAAICHDTYSAHQGVEHDDMNVLCIGARVIGPDLAREIVSAFLAARYTPGERHSRRLDKVLRLERDGLTG